MIMWIKIASGAMAMTGLLIGLAAQREPVHETFQTAQAQEAPVEWRAAAKSDRLPLAFAALPPPAPTPEPVIEVANGIDLASRAEQPRPRKPHRDICTRHGMHKQITRGGKSWRCRG